MTNFDDQVDVGDVKGSEVGLSVQKWDYPGVGYHLSKGKLFLDGEAVPELKVTVFALATWKNVTVGKMKNKRTIASYPVYEKRTNMVQGEGVENRIQVIIKVEDKLYVFGSGSTNTYGAWLKDNRNAQYFAPDLDLGIWTQLQAHIARVKRETGKTIPQFGWSFTVAPAQHEIETGGEYNQTITPLVRISGFKFVGEQEFKANEALYLTEGLDEWVETRSNPNGVVTTGVEGTVVEQPETADTYNEVPPEDTDEIPF